MKIRPYLPTDWHRLCTIHDAARVHELAGAGLLDAFLTLAQTAENEGLFAGVVVVAEDDTEVVGFAAHCDGELTWLYVDPHAFRRGVGRALLRHCLLACGGRLSTEVLLGNDAALALYLSEGFTIVQRSDGRLVGNEDFAASGYVLQYPAPGAAPA